MSRQISVVLHESIYSSNVGSVARAMGNMGITRLVLVNPLCEINEDAKKAAVGCQEILINHVVYGSWQDFYRTEGEGLRIAFTARPGKLRPSRDAEELFQDIGKDENLKNTHVYLIFGREDSGLSTDDIEFCHQTCTLKTYGEYTSLNLSHAVMLGLYVVSKNLTVAPDSNLQALPTQALYYPAEDLREWLTTLGFDISAKRINAYKVLNRLILRNQPEQKELKILKSVLKQTIRKLKERNLIVQTPTD